MKKIFLLLAAMAGGILAFSSPGLAEDEKECCCEITCTYERALGGSTTTIEVDQCWDMSQISSCDEDTACLKVKNVWLTYTNEWSGAGCREQDPCPISLFYVEGDPKLENLRTFRDDTLARSAIGRRIINMYYDNAGTVKAALERSPALKATVKWALDVLAPLVGKKEA